MANKALAGDDPRWTRLYVSAAKDFVLRESITEEQAARLAVGADHPQKSKYPDHKFSGFVQDEAGRQLAVYVKDRASQEAYNSEFRQVLSGRWGPEIRQTFVFLRSAWSPALTTPSAPPSTFDGAFTWTFIGEEQVQLEAPLNGLLVQVVRIWIDRSTGVVSEDIDPETGEVTSSTQTLVPAGTAATPIDNNGIFATVEGITPFWAIKSVRQAGGLAGQAVNGKASRTLEKHVRYFWPAVLGSLYLRVITADLSDIFSEVTDFIEYPVWKAYAYNGPCKARITEMWTKVKPTFAGDPNWPSSGTEPYIPEPTVLQPRPISFRGAYLKNINVESCLHPAFTFYDAGFVWNEPATSPEVWPATLVADVDMRPYLMGYLTTIVEVDAPSEDGTGGSLVLALAQVISSTSVKLSWNTAGSGTTLEVSTTPDFSRGLLLNGVSVNSTAPLEYTVTGLTRGTPYYARLTRSGIKTNTVQFMGSLEGELEVYNGVNSVAHNATVTMDTTEVGESTQLTLNLQNAGIMELTSLSGAITGTHAAMFTLGTVPTSLQPGEDEDIIVTFTPSATGVKSAILTLPSSDPDTPHVINLSATATQVEVHVKYGVTDQANGSTVEFTGTTNVGSTTDYTLTIENTGTGAMPVSAVLTDDGGVWAIQTQPAASVAGGGSTTMVLRFTPTADGAAAGVLSITTSDTDEDPYLLNLVAVGHAEPNLTVANPWSGDAAHNSTLNMGALVHSASRSLNFTLGNNGTETLNGLSLAMSGSNFTCPAGLSVTSLAPGETTTIAIVFTTDAGTGTKTGSLTVTSDDPGTPSYVVNLSAEVKTSNYPIVQVERPSGTILADGATTVNFGHVLVTGGTQVETFTFRNIGSNPSTTNTTSITGTHSAEFVASAIASNIAALDSGNFTVTFDPAGYGPRTASMAVQSNGDNPSVDIDIALTGTGVPANPLLTGQSAAVIIGQADGDDQSTSVTSAIARGATHMAVSGTGRLALVDIANHRVLIWNTQPTVDGTPADYVLGQADFTSSSANRGGSVAANTLSSPTGVAWHGANLWVSDSGNNRVVRYVNPRTNGMAATVVLGQTDFTSGSSRSAASFDTRGFSSPQRVFVYGSKLMVVDTFHNRVLIWSAVPTASNTAANVVVGQGSTTGSSSGTTATTLAQPTDVCVLSTGKLCVCDSGNNRVLLYASIPSAHGATATVVIGQADFVSSGTGTTAALLNAPYAVAAKATGTQLAIADEQNNRVLLHYIAPTTNGASAHAVLGQTDFTTGSGSTSGYAVMTNPRGLRWSGNTLYVAGSGMKRCMKFNAEA